MKKILPVLGVFVLMSIMYTSCSKDDNPVDNNAFVGTYRGTISYKSTGTDISKNNGSITVVKVGDRYDFNYSDGIPAIKNVIMEKGQGGYVGTVNGYTGFIKINASNLTIGVLKDGAAWGANTNR